MRSILYRTRAQLFGTGHCGSVRATFVHVTAHANRWSTVRLSARSALVAALTAVACVGQSASLRLMPMPARVSMASGKLVIDSGFSVRVEGYSDRRLRDAAARLEARVSLQTGIPLQHGSKDVLVVECRTGGTDYPALSDDESYRLDVTDSAARLAAPTVAGALRGMETFSQLIAADAESFYVPALKIEDRPRFPWRGFMLDVSRHWMPLPVIERNLDAMAAVKLNVFHWHLADDQGFRVESKLFPKLQGLGSDGNFYSQDDVRHVVAYARDRGIRVVPEFDIPGHTTSWFVGYPELASAPGPYQIERNWGIFEPVMDPSREDVYKFLDALLGEMAGLFPDPFFHIGGDEVLDKQWKNNPSIQAFAKKNRLDSSAALHAYFNRRVQTLLSKHGKQMIGWDEVLAPELSRDVVIQSWRGQKSLAEAARGGHRGILSYGYYLDHMQPASAHYQVDPLSNEAGALPAEEAALILGGEACMWTEYVDAENVDSRLWPRLAVIAERLWSPRDTSDLHSMYARLDAVSDWLEWTGVRDGASLGILEQRSGADNRALRVLTNAVEALGIDQRQRARHYNSLVPLNRLADAARPESETVRHLEEIASALTGDPAARQQKEDELRTAFTLWSQNTAALRDLFNTRFYLAEAAPVSEDLSRIGNIGLRALQYLESGQNAPREWINEQERALDRFATPRAEVSLAAVRPVRVLLDALSGGAGRTERTVNPGASH